jgi:hypothetical protein
LALFFVEAFFVATPVVHGDRLRDNLGRGGGVEAREDPDFALVERRAAVGEVCCSLHTAAIGSGDTRAHTVGCVRHLPRVFVGIEGGVRASLAHRASEHTAIHHLGLSASRPGRARAEVQLKRQVSNCHDTSGSLGKVLRERSGHATFLGRKAMPVHGARAGLPRD